MTHFIEPPQRGATITYEGVTDEEFQVWMEEISDCVNNISPPIPPSDNTIIINGFDIGNLTLGGRSTEFETDGLGNATFTHFDNFSYHVTPVDEVFNIPAAQQMIVHNGLEIEGILDVEGELILE